MSVICIAENSGGLGGVGGGAGAQGQASQQAPGYAARGYGYPVIECTTGMTAGFDVQLTRDYASEIPSDLQNVASVTFLARPTMKAAPSADDISVACSFTPGGLVSFELTPEHLNYNEGIWYAEFLCRDAENALVQTYRAYLCIRKGMDGTRGGSHTVMPLDIRLALMDTDPELNSVLDDLEFSDAMILNAVQRAIDEWEETPPALSRRFNATNFPYREHLIKGAVGYLLQSVMYRYMRNRMQYSAAGLTLDKNDKGASYLQLSQMARAEWKAFVAAGKTSLNMQECMGVVAQPWFGSID